MEFLLLAVVVSAVGITIVAIRHRRPKTGMRASIDEFEKAREAIAPPPPDDDRPSRGAQGPG
ncbi:MAG TPA: hypothetical protein VF441_00655 [Acidimicrobiia bacterium]